MAARYTKTFFVPTVIGLTAALLLSACNNQYEPPVDGKPLTWGQQYYFDNKRYQQLNLDRIN